MNCRVLGYQFPQGLEEWSDFDYVDSGKSDRLTAGQIRHIERFANFMNNWPGADPRYQNSFCRKLREVAI